MRRKKPDLQVQVTCDHCGDKTETFVSSYPDYKKFCRIHTPGKEPEKDCMTEYYKEKNHVQKKEKEGCLWTQQKKQPQEEEKEIKLYDKKTAIRKLDELKQFLNRKKYPTSPILPQKNDSKI